MPAWHAGCAVLLPTAPLPLQMVYGRSTVFGSASDAPTFGRIYEAFGPTYPGGDMPRTQRGVGRLACSTRFLAARAQDGAISKVWKWRAQHSAACSPLSCAQLCGLPAGEPDAEVIGGYPLQYPGILLLFPSPAHQAPGGPVYGAEGGGRGAGAFPVPLSVPAERIYIHAGARGAWRAALCSAAV